MRIRGINYDVGTFTVRSRSSRPHFDHDVVRRELQIIARDLHCTAVRISGEEIGRLAYAAECATAEGLEVWLSPAFVDADEAGLLPYLGECAQLAERLRSGSGKVTFIVGCELSVFMRGLIAGETTFDRLGTMMRPWRLLRSTLSRGSFNWLLNRFLTKAVAAVRTRFGGQLAYAAGTWEGVDWSPFDIVAVDHYRDRRNRDTYGDALRRYAAQGKPVVVTEFGCSTYRGAEERGGLGWTIVDRSQDPPGLTGTFTRDESLQADEIAAQFDLLEAAGVEGAFLFTFVMPTYPTSADPSHDLDMASYAVVKTYADRSGDVFHGVPWDPKESFYRLAELYDRQ